MLKAIETIKIIAISILFVLLICLYAVYVSAAQSANDSQGEEIPPEKLMVFNTDYSPKAYKINRSQLLPEFIGVVSEGAGLSTLYDRAMTSAFSDSMLPLTSSLFSSSAVFEALGESAGGDAWQSALDMPNYIYMRWTGNIPLAALSLYYCEEDINYTMKGYACELIIYPSPLGTPAAYTRDSQGAVTYIAGDPALEKNIFNDNMIRAYTDTVGGTPFELYGRNPQEGGYTDALGQPLALPDTTPIAGSFTYSAKILCENPVSLDKTGGEYERITRLLQLLEFNVYLPNDYDLNDVYGFRRTYIGSSGSNLRIPSAGVIEYRSNGTDGIALSGFLGHSAPSYSVWDIIKAAGIFADNIPRDLAGGEADLCMSTVYRSGGNVCVGFSYFIDGIRVAWSGQDDINHPDVVLTYSDSCLVNMTIRPMKITRMERIERVRNFPPEMYLRQIDGGDISRLMLTYSVDFEQESFAAAYRALVRTSDSGGDENTDLIGHNTEDIK